MLLVGIVISFVYKTVPFISDKKGLVLRALNPVNSKAQQVLSNSILFIFLFMGNITIEGKVLHFNVGMFTFYYQLQQCKNVDNIATLTCNDSKKYLDYLFTCKRILC